MARFYMDEDGNYVYDKTTTVNDDPDEVYWDGARWQIFCDDCDEFHTRKCPVAERIDRYTTVRQESDNEWLTKFEKEWEFWLFLHPDTKEGDSKKASKKALRGFSLKEI